jgi:hypothetical protein
MGHEKKMERAKGRSWMSQAGTPKFRAYLRQIGLDKNRASEVQRIGALPTNDGRRAGQGRRRGQGRDALKA